MASVIGGKALAPKAVVAELSRPGPYPVLRGELALVGLPGEPFAEGGLRIKLGSPTFPTYVVHNTCYAAYVPTRAAIERGGYETRAGLISKLAPEALDLIVEASLGLLRELFA